MKPSRRDCFVLLWCSVGTFWGSHAHADNPAKPILTGVSLAGGEFGTHLPEFCNEQPGELGREYIFPRPETVEYFSKAGLQLVRLPFRWERLQPKLGAELNAAYLEEIKKVTRAALKHDVFVILDLHNYGRYRIRENGAPREYVIDQEVEGRVPVSRAHFADVWRRLTLEFRNDRAVVGYALMNEPHDMGSSDWKAISQNTVAVIRKIDRRTVIVVSGDDWSSAERFDEANGPKPWIRDPGNRIVYEAHCYFDTDASGKYQHAFEVEAKADPEIANRGVKRVKPFLDWCRRNHVRGFIGEFGSPPDPQWREVTQRFLRACDAAQVGVCYWAAGEWWGDYPLSIHPVDESKSAAPQLKWLQNPRISSNVSTSKSAAATRIASP